MPPPTTCLYECSVMHRRISPKVHHFKYNIFLLSLDLDTLDATAARLPILSHNRWNLYNFRDRDHLTLPGLEKAPLKQNILTWIRQQPNAPANLPAEDPEIQIHLITLPRVLGYVFNPVSFYFLTHRPTAQPLCAVVQVCNTFKELKPYLLLPTPTNSHQEPETTNEAPKTKNQEPRTRNSPPPYRLTTPKNFYVSPFSDLDLHFDFTLHPPGDHLQIHINDRPGPTASPILLSTLAGKRHPLTTSRLLWLTAKFPLITLKIILLIHWQALRLWLKKLPFHKKSTNPHLQKDLYNPHR